jgi:hypothetical protein
VFIVMSLVTRRIPSFGYFAVKLDRWVRTDQIAIAMHAVDPVHRAPLFIGFR